MQVALPGHLVELEPDRKIGDDFLELAIEIPSRVDDVAPGDVGDADADEAACQEVLIDIAKQGLLGLHELYPGYRDADKVRFFVLSTHYRRPGPIRFTGKSEEDRPITLGLNAIGDPPDKFR